MIRYQTYIIFSRSHGFDLRSHEADRVREIDQPRQDDNPNPKARLARVAADGRPEVYCPVTMSLQVYCVNGHRRALGYLGHGGGVQEIAVTSTGASSRESWHISPKIYITDNQRRSTLPQTHNMDHNTLLNSLPF